ncbi:lysine exporter LysO family protein [Neisseriaceae bacterium B1]
MENLLGVLWILLPMFIGFAICVPKIYVPILGRILSGLVYLLLLLIGMGLAHVENLVSQLDNIAVYVATLFGLLMVSNIAALMLFDRFLPWQQRIVSKHATKKINLLGSLQQPAVVIVGFLLGAWLPETWLPPEKASTYALMLLIFCVGVQLRSNGIPLRQVLLNKRGIQVGVVFVGSCLLAGLIFAAVFDEVSWGKGLALASGFGWYSLSGIVMTQAYDAMWGSVALLNDLLREFLALVLIPTLMRRSPAAAVGIGGATSLDFTLPVIQSSGGLAVVPLAISFGFVVNVVSPLLMVLFSAG